MNWEAKFNFLKEFLKKYFIQSVVGHLCQETNSNSMCVLLDEESRRHEWKEKNEIN